MRMGMVNMPIRSANGLQGPQRAKNLPGNAICDIWQECAATAWWSLVNGKYVNQAASSWVNDANFNVNLTCFFIHGETYEMPRM